MKTILAILFGSLVTAAAQVGPSVSTSTNAWLWCRNLTAASNVLSTIDTACGYPNPATLTWTAVPHVDHPTTNWSLVPITLYVYSPKVKGYVLVSGLLSTNTLGTLKTNVPATAVQTQQITESAAAMAGFWPTNAIADVKTNAVEIPK